MEREILRVENIEKKFDGKEVLKNISFTVYENDFFFILGPSGCGKTTFLRIIAGFTQPDRGRIILNKKDITNLPPNKRNIGFVFQNYALWPHMKVKENIAYGLKIRKYTDEFVKRKVEEMLEITKLKEIKDLYPNQISGGQQQRVALARALIVDPLILLLDEPLSNLDAKLRDELRRELKRIHKETEKTMIYVTHDQKEAMTLSTNIAIMKDKEIIQIGSPYEIYTNPKNLFVASFIGEINVIKGKIVEKIKENLVKIETDEGYFFSDLYKIPNSKDIFLCFRPESITKEERINVIKGRLKEYEFLGETLKLSIITEKGNIFKLSISPYDFEKYRRGENIIFSVEKEKFIILEE
ncbi:MAG: ABC transporter ATP-binding protein [Candidatus Omnitrophica bacterium]|nr:ABC transporter ATP-binding protein [Candidatus Omnitrophota bacterium]